MLQNGEQVVAIVIARGGSKSIPRKNVLPLHGKPLVTWPIDTAKSVSRVDRVLISTDDDEIMAIAKAHGAEAPFTRPQELSTDEVTTLPVLQHCLRYLEEKERYVPQIVLLLYPTAPFLKKERVDEALDLFERKRCNSVISVVKDWGRFWGPEDGSEKYIPLHPKERVNRQYYKPLYREDGSVYFSRRDVIMKENRLVDEQSTEFLFMRDGENIDIDEPEDFKDAQMRKNT